MTKWQAELVVATPTARPVRSATWVAARVLGTRPYEAAQELSDEDKQNMAM